VVRCSSWTNSPCRRGLIILFWRLVQLVHTSSHRRGRRPSLNHVLAISMPRNFSHGSFYVFYSQADARDTRTCEPVAGSNT